jgi:hypothetical protein
MGEELKVQDKDWYNAAKTRNKVAPATNAKTYSTGGKKEVQGKSKLSLVPLAALERIADRIEESIPKYGKDNWKKGFPISECVDAAMRHLYAYSAGENSEDHLAAALTNLAFATHFEVHFANNKEVNDIEKEIK